MRSLTHTHAHIHKSMDARRRLKAPQAPEHTMVKNVSLFIRRIYCIVLSYVNEKISMGHYYIICRSHFMAFVNKNCSVDLFAVILTTIKVCIYISIDATPTPDNAFKMFFDFGEWFFVLINVVIVEVKTEIICQIIEMNFQRLSIWHRWPFPTRAKHCWNSRQKIPLYNHARSTNDTSNTLDPFDHDCNNDNDKE